MSQRLRELLGQYETMLLGVFVVLVAFMAFSSEFFFTPLNLKNILISVSVTGILAVPMTLLLVAGDLDISVASVAAFSGMLLVKVSDGGDGSLLTGVIVALAAGLLAGVINGALVAGLGLNSIITTLGTLAVFRGATRLVSNGQSVILHGFKWLGSGSVLGVPVQILLVTTITVVAGLMLHYTVHGRRIYATGSNRGAARLAGIRVGRVTFALFVLSGLLAGVAGLVVSSQLRAASPVVLEGLELVVITAVIVGGASLHGGKGTVIGVVIGVLILGTLNNGLTILSISAFWQEIIQGAVLIFAISFDQIREIRRARRGA